MPSKKLTGVFFFFQAEDGIRDGTVTGVQTCALPISRQRHKKLYARPWRVLVPAQPLHLLETNGNDARHGHAGCAGARCRMHPPPAHRHSAAGAGLDERSAMAGSVAQIGGASDSAIVRHGCAAQLSWRSAARSRLGTTGK